jgi:hypothetical protein
MCTIFEKVKKCLVKVGTEPFYGLAYSEVGPDVEEPMLEN